MNTFQQWGVGRVLPHWQIHLARLKKVARLCEKTRVKTPLQESQS